MKILGRDDRFRLPVLNHERRVLDAIDGPPLAPVAGPHVNVVKPLELDPAREQTVKQGLVDIDRMPAQEILVPGVDLRPHLNLAQAQKDDRNVGQACVDLFGVGREEAALGDGREAGRHERFRAAGLRA